MSGLQCQLSYGPKFLPPSGNLIVRKKEELQSIPLTHLSYQQLLGWWPWCTVHFLKIQKNVQFQNFCAWKNVSCVIFHACILYNVRKIWKDREIKMIEIVVEWFSQFSKSKIDFLKSFYVWFLYQNKLYLSSKRISAIDL